MTPTIKSYAFYLPQFHPTAENDEWWGKGFTEWTNVARARSRFPGHEQPRLPTDLGFYDLRVPEVRHQQAELAKAHGIDGFVYYHYWFNGRRLLNRPIDDMLADPSTDMPFALCWANEDWRRNWDGFSGELLVEQEHSDEDDEAHIAWLLEAFADPRYIRVDGKPMFLVYRAARIPNVSATLKRWRERAREAGIGELHLCRVESDNDEFDNTPEELGFDAAVEFGVEWRHIGAGSSQGSVSVHSYADTAHRTLQRTAAPYRRHAGVGTGFDNTPRRPKGGIALDGATPALYQEWLARTVQREILRSPNANEIPIFINAWNEWAEGAILEPCSQWGTGFLEAHRDGVQEGMNAEITGTALESDNFASLSVAVVTSGGASDVMTCLNNALAAAINEREVAFIVVDNGSTDETRVLLRELDSAITTLRNDTHQPAWMAWLRALDASESNHVVLVSPDVRLHANAVSSARLVLDKAGPSKNGVLMNIDNNGITVSSNHLNAETGVAMLIDVARFRTRMNLDHMAHSTITAATIERSDAATVV